MRLKDGLRLRKVGPKYMIANADGGQQNVAEVFTLNEVAAQMWQHVEGRDFSVKDLVEWLCQEYDVEQSVAQADVVRQLEEWKEFGLLKDA